jgi:hypothetical protein
MGAINSQTARRAKAIVPSDTLPNNFSGIYVGGAGDVAVLMAGDTDSVVHPNVPAGALLPIQVQKVLVAGTTATLMVGYFE